MLRRILVKDYANRIDWKELFEFTITENGDIYAPGVTPGAPTQFGLRASIRNSSGFGSGLNFNNSHHGYSSHNNSSLTNDSVKGGSPILSPKPMKEGEDARTYLMKKKSPLKADDGSSGNNASINYTSYSKNDHYSKNDRTNRFDLLLKNHGKCTTLNQMILDLFRLDQPKSLYISYYLYRSIEKEITSLSDSLKKEAYSDSNDPFREFKSIVEKELENVKLNLLMMKECIEDEG